MTDSPFTLFDTLRPSTWSVAAGQTVFRQGDPATAIFQVRHGAIVLEKEGETVFRAGPGRFFAESALFADNYIWTARAVGDSTVAVFSKAKVLLLLRAHPDLNLAFSAYLSRQTDDLHRQGETLRLKGAADRVVHFLKTTGAIGRTVFPEGSLTVLAGDLGLTREALYRTLAALERNGVLEREGRRGLRLVVQAGSRGEDSTA